MIISKTPLRIGFFSGGSDIPAYYRKAAYGGAALSVTVNKYIYVSVHRTNHTGLATLFPYASEEVQDLEHMRHAITREALRMYSVENHATVTSVSDVPAFGTGLGSSSAFTVGLLNCLSKAPHRETSLYWRENMARDACQVEIEKCGYPIGKQDSFAAAMGGFNFFKFRPDESVEIERIYLSEDVMNRFQSNLILLHTGKGHSANAILKQQVAAMDDDRKYRLITDNRDRAYLAREMLHEGRLDDFGAVLHEAWEAKKQVVAGISDDYYDSIYNTAITNGALGGKLLGAGGGGFFLFYCPPNDQARMLLALTRNHPCTTVWPFRFVFHGSKIVAEC